MYVLPFVSGSCEGALDEVVSFEQAFSGEGLPILNIFAIAGAFSLLFDDFTFKLRSLQLVKPVLLSEPVL